MTTLCGDVAEHYQITIIDSRQTSHQHLKTNLGPELSLSMPSQQYSTNHHTVQVSTETGDCVRVQFPVWDIYLGILPAPRSTQPGHPFVGRCNEYQPKDHYDALRLGSKGRHELRVGGT